MILNHFHLFTVKIIKANFRSVKVIFASLLPVLSAIVPSALFEDT